MFRRCQRTSGSISSLALFPSFGRLKDCAHVRSMYDSLARPMCHVRTYSVGVDLPAEKCDRRNAAALSNSGAVASSLPSMSPLIRDEDLFDDEADGCVDDDFGDVALRHDDAESAPEGSDSSSSFDTAIEAEVEFEDVSDGDALFVNRGGFAQSGDGLSIMTADESSSVEGRLGALHTSLSEMDVGELMEGFLAEEVDTAAEENVKQPRRPAPTGERETLRGVRHLHSPASPSVLSRRALENVSLSSRNIRDVTDDEGGMSIEEIETVSLGETMRRK